MLAEIVTRIARETQTADPKELAEKVIAAIPDEERDAAFHEAMVAFVMSRVTRDRRGVPQPGVSKKVAAVRTAWARFLMEPVQINGSWKQVGDCDVAEVEILAAQRREVARKNMAHAQRFEALAADMRKQGVARVRDFKSPSAALAA